MACSKVWWSWKIYSGRLDFVFEGLIALEKVFLEDWYSVFNCHGPRNSNFGGLMSVLKVWWSWENIFGGLMVVEKVFLLVLCSVWKFDYIGKKYSWTFDVLFEGLMVPEKVLLEVWCFA